MSINEYNVLLKQLKEATKASRISAKKAQEISDPLINAVNQKRAQLSFEFGLKLPILTFQEYLSWK